MKTKNARKATSTRTAVTVRLDPIEYGIFSAAAKARGHSNVEGALQEFLDKGQGVLDFQNNGFQLT
jgi:hypothetical protein